MIVSALTNAPQIVANEAAKEAEAASNQNNQDSVQEKNVEFLQLLLVQLENQNPLEPTDTNELTNQLIQQSQLEQQLITNDTLSNLAAKIDSSTKFSSLGYIGKQIEVLDNAAPVQNGEASFAYVIDGEPDLIELTVTNANGDILYKTDGEKGVGPYKFTFDASQSEFPVADGEAVFLFINAQDKEGQSLNGLISGFANIDSVDSSTGDTLLTAGNLSYSLDQILRIAGNATTEPTETTETP